MTNNKTQQQLNSI